MVGHIIDMYQDDDDDDYNDDHDNDHESHFQSVHPSRGRVSLGNDRSAFSPVRNSM
jgi:hypothetical protein